MIIVKIMDDGKFFLFQSLYVRRFDEREAYRVFDGVETLQTGKSEIITWYAYVSFLREILSWLKTQNMEI